MKTLLLSLALVFMLAETVRADLTITSNVGFDAIVVVRDPAKPNAVDDLQVTLKLNESKTFPTYGRDVKVFVFDKQTRMQMCSGIGPANGNLKIETAGAQWKLK